MFQFFRKGLQNAQIRRAFQIEHPTSLFRLIVIIKANFLQCLSHLAAAVVDAMRFAYKGDDDISVGRFIEDYFGMTCSNDLRVKTRANIGEKIIGLALPENFEVCIGFIEQQNRTGIGVQMSQQ